MNIDGELNFRFKTFRRDPCNATMLSVVSAPQFSILFENIFRCEENSMGALIVAYLKDVSSMLALVSAVRDMDIGGNIQAERKLVAQFFAFDHQNYARYGAYQHVKIQQLKHEGHPAFSDMLNKGFGGSITGDKFSTILNSSIKKQIQALSDQGLVQISMLSIHG